jgi:hypothetical protein
MLCTCILNGSLWLLSESGLQRAKRRNRENSEEVILGKDDGVQTMKLMVEW